jgi:hypothetical protein
MIHVAGPLIDGVQVCTRCECILTDYRGAMVEAGSPPLFGWAEGAHVEVVEGWPRSSSVTDAPPDCETRH